MNIKSNFNIHYYERDDKYKSFDLKYNLKNNRSILSCLFLLHYYCFKIRKKK